MIFINIIFFLDYKILYIFSKLLDNSWMKSWQEREEDEYNGSYLVLSDSINTSSWLLSKGKMAFRLTNDISFFSVYICALSWQKYSLLTICFVFTLHFVIDDATHIPSNTEHNLFGCIPGLGRGWILLS